MPESRPTVFVSYSHKDAKRLDEVLPFLEVLKLDQDLELWSDRNIGGGEDWYAAIVDRLRDARVAILLVTVNFLTSRFCRFEELPVLLQRQAKGKLALLPVIVQACPWKGQRWLKRPQLPLGTKPLDQFAKPQRNEQLTKLAEEVRKIAVDGVTPPKLALPSWPVESFDLRKLPETGSLLFGRRKELQLLDKAWDEGETNVVVFTAGGGVGKSTLCRVWCEDLALDSWRGAHRAFAWSFYSQGTGRQGSADTFINAVFRWFGEDPGDLSPWQRGSRLAELVRRERMLLVLDGVEPLQSSSAFDRGVLRDLTLKTLLQDLAENNPGLCLVSTRELMTDLAAFTRPAVIHHDLNQVSSLAGRALMRVAGVRGEDEELEASVQALGRHALAVNLLATYIADTEGRHIGTIRDLPEPDPTYGPDTQPRRVIEAWAIRLGESPELELLNHIGLFDRPATGPELAALREPPAVKGLNQELLAGDYDQAVARLRTVRLLAGVSAHEPNTVDAHPLARQHFDERLQATKPNAWTAGHDRLYKHLTTTTEDKPDTLEGLAPLYAALAHGCAAGRQQEALHEVYNRRIDRGDFFSVRQLGSFGSDLAGLIPFFEEPWRKPLATLAPPVQARLLNLAGGFLTAIGRLADAAEPSRAALEAAVKASAWAHAALQASNLSELQLGLGAITEAAAFAGKAVEYANGVSLSDSMVAHSSLATALHQAGQMDEAEVLFREAEVIQAKVDPAHAWLYSTRGLEYCELLLQQGKAKEVLERAQVALEDAEGGPLQELAINHLSFGRACLDTGDLQSAAPHLQQAVDGLRRASVILFVPRGFLARAKLNLVTFDFERCRSDLTESLTLCTRIGLRLFEADTWLGFARLHLATGDREKARQVLAKARAIIEDTGYGRRLEELAELEGQLGHTSGSGDA